MLGMYTVHCLQPPIVTIPVHCHSIVATLVSYARLLYKLTTAITTIQIFAWCIINSLCSPLCSCKRWASLWLMCAQQAPFMMLHVQGDTPLLRTTLRKRKSIHVVIVYWDVFCWLFKTAASWGSEYVHQWTLSSNSLICHNKPDVTWVYPILCVATGGRTVKCLESLQITLLLMSWEGYCSTGTMSISKLFLDTNWYTSNYVLIWGALLRATSVYASGDNELTCGNRNSSKQSHSVYMLS